MTPGSQIGPYKIVASIGAGGMGEVFRARDTRLNRDVAVAVKSETTFETGVPKALFDLGSIRGVIPDGHYAVTRDGQRFLIVTHPEKENAEPINVVVNWTKDLKR